MKKRELKKLIEQGEGYFVEFKEQINQIWALYSEGRYSWRNRQILKPDKF
jgi:hypothetical protein